MLEWFTETDPDKGTKTITFYNMSISYTSVYRN